MNMFEMIKSFPNQIESQHKNLSDLEFDLNKYKNINNILIVGMGGSAISGDIISNLLREKLSLPITVVRGYTLPRWVDDKSLIILSSYSGNTEETLSVYDYSKARSSMLISVTTGGVLQEKSNKDEIPSISMPTGFQPRAALGLSLTSLMMIFSRLNLIDSSTIDDFLSSSRELPLYFDDSCQEKQYAYDVAQQISDGVLSIYGTESGTDVVASRFRAQIAENSKIISSHHILPELDHNEIEGWNSKQFKDQKMNIVWLQDHNDHERVKKRVQVTSDLLSEIGINNIFISCDGDSFLSRQLKLILLTDMISYYLAIINEVDPIPVDRIMNLKEKLS